MFEGMFEATTGRARMDVDMIHDFLSRESYWAKGRSQEDVERTIENSLCFGVFEDGMQIGFGRLVTDRVVFGYVADVFVLPAHRGKGASKALMKAMMEHPLVASLQVVLLRTVDAHTLYSPFGFAALPRPEEMMGRYLRPPAEPRVPHHGS